MKKYKIEQYLEAEECSCGGVFSVRTGNSLYLTNPPQAEFTCDRECGEIMRLSEPYWPQIKTRRLGVIND